MVAMNQKKSLSLREINDRFIIDPLTGEIFWCIGRLAGQQAGTVLDAGYRKIGFRQNGKFVQHYAHHIMWAFCHGKWPTFHLDHVNSNKGDNRIENLRPASFNQNRVNTGQTSYNESGLKWVSLHKNSVERGKPNPWQAAVWFGKDRRQKYFPTKEQAHEWACIQAKQLHGEFYNPGQGG